MCKFSFEYLYQPILLMESQEIVKVHIKMSEKFVLKWTDFQSNILKSVGSLRTEDDFHDVTLVSSDQRRFSAHKLLLSASSSYFKNILRQNKVPNIHLCLENANAKDVTYILDYIYNGEVQVPQDDLTRFIEVSQRFQLEGLLGLETNEKQTDEYESKVESYQDTKIEEEIPDFYPVAPTISRSETKFTVKGNFTSVEEIDAEVMKNMYRDSNYVYHCKLCNRSSKKKDHIREHIETHIDGIFLVCDFCGKKTTSRKSMRQSHANKKCLVKQEQKKINQWPTSKLSLADDLILGIQ